MFKNEDDMVECPYNKAHLMLRKRLQSHLLKCRIHYPNVELMKCPFNVTHLVPEPEFTHHVTNCSDRKLIAQYKYDAPEEREEEKPTHAPIECEENWDDTDVADYDPAKYLETANILRIPEGSNPSERKQFIKKERRRLGDNDSDDEQNVDNGQQGAALPAVSHYQDYESQIQDYNSSRRGRSRSPLSGPPNEHANSYQERGPTPPPPMYSDGSYREEQPYNADNNPYYNQNTDWASSSSNSRGQYHNPGNESYTERNRDYYNRGSRRGRDYNDRTPRNADGRFNSDYAPYPHNFTRRY